MKNMLIVMETIRNFKKVDLQDLPRLPSRMVLKSPQTNITELSDATILSVKYAQYLV